MFYNDKEISRTTSGTFSVSGLSIAMVVDVNVSSVHTELEVDVREEKLRRDSGLPFYKR